MSREQIIAVVAVVIVVFAIIGWAVMRRGGEQATSQPPPPSASQQQTPPQLPPPRSSPSWSGMAAKVGLSVEVQGDDMVVSLPGTSYAAFPRQLLTKSHSGREDQGAPMTQAEFHTRAWKAR